MNSDQLQQYRKQLLALREELEALNETGSGAGETVVLDQSRVGRLSRMDAMQAQQMALETARRRQQKLVKIEGALRRIESGEFGHCFVCGETIDAARLNFDLTSTRCVDCQSE
jgi:DnaK suppressor protein